MSDIRSVAVVGLGLIGGSFEKAARAAGLTVFGVHHSDTTGWETADLVIVALPPEAIVPWIKSVLRVTHAQGAREGTASPEAKPSLRSKSPEGCTTGFKPGAIVIDICGTKRQICAEMAQIPQEGWRFIGGHPMAGREVSGYANSKADLFVGASMILTPVDPVVRVTHAHASPDLAESLAALKVFFKTVGFLETVVTTPERHDEMIAFTSQLCHVIATSYARDPRVRDAPGFSAGSYANMTRIATQDAAIWSDLYRVNRDALVPVLDGFIARVQALRDAIAQDDVKTVQQLISEGTKAKRDELLARRRGDE